MITEGFEILSELILRPLPMPKTRWYQRLWCRAAPWKRRIVRQFELYQTFAVRLGHNILEAPKGAIIDGASTPSQLWSWLGSPVDYLLEWAALHDPGYGGTLKWLVIEDDGSRTLKDYSKKELDDLVLALVPHYNIPPVKAWVANKGVRWLGGGAYKKARASNSTTE